MKVAQNASELSGPLETERPQVIHNLRACSEHTGIYEARKPHLVRLAGLEELSTPFLAAALPLHQIPPFSHTGVVNTCHLLFLFCEFLTQ